MTNSEILIPFALDVHGNIATTQDPNVQQMQHVDSIISTYPGERVMLPRYGVPFRDWVFGGPNTASQEMTQAVTSQMAMWEPTIQVLSITPNVDDSTNGVVSLDVDFTTGVNATPTTVQTAVVYVGGKVIES
jgi:hypothetical protein